MITLHEIMLPTSAGVEPATSWSPVGRRIQMSHRGRHSPPWKRAMGTLKALGDALVMSISQCFSSWSNKDVMLIARKWPLCNLWTKQCAGWSGPLLPAYRTNGYCGAYRWTENGQTNLHGCARSSGHSLFTNGENAVFLRFASSICIWILLTGAGIAPVF